MVQIEEASFDTDVRAPCVIIQLSGVPCVKAEYARLYDKYKGAAQGGNQGGNPNQGTSVRDLPAPESNQLWQYKDLIDSQKSAETCPPLGYTTTPEVPQPGASPETVEVKEDVSITGSSAFFIAGDAKAR